MKCYNHFDVEAIGTCSRCGKAICSSCSVDVSGRITCTQCLSSGSNLYIQNQPYRPSNTLAIISLVLGVLSLCGGIFFSIPAWITGQIALNQIFEDPIQDGGQLATAGKILGMVITILYGVAIIGYVAFIIIAVITSFATSY